MKTIRILTLSLVVGCTLAACRPSATFLEAAPEAAYECSSTDRACATVQDVGELPGRSAPFGCSVFTVAKGDRVFFGGNDDYINLDSYYWVEPGQGDNYGVIWIGTPDDVQQGMNEMGLAYDANGLPEVEMNPHRERTPWSGHMGSAQMHILHECATVEEAIEWVQTHQVWPQMNDQRQFADASGDAVLISPGPDGELVFTRKPPGDGYLVSTNFNVIDPEHRNGGYPCSRYETAQGMLGQLVEGRGALTVQDAAEVLDAVHQEGDAGWTRNSLVADLPNGVIYLYYFHQFDRPVVLNVADELAHPRAPGSLSVLFPDDVRQEAARRYARIQEKSDRCRWGGIAWIAGVLACLALLLVFSPRSRRALLFWVPVVTVLGPLGLLVWLVVGRGQKPGGWRAALLETAGDVTPTVVALAAYLALALFGPTIMGSDLVQLVLILGLPLVLGWLVFQGPLLAWATKTSYLRTLWKRLPNTLVAANLGMAGASAVATLLVKVSTRTCSIIPSAGWVAGILWPIVVLCALMGGLLLFIYQSWAVRRGLSAWRVLAWGDGEVRGEIRSGPWRVLWWWVLLSYAALVGGVVASMLAAQLLSA